MLGSMNETSSESFGGIESAPAMVVSDLGCVSCGYNLLGLRTHVVCPECGIPVSRSMLGDLLEFASIEYVSKLYRGAQTVVGGILLYVIVMIVSLALAVLTVSAGMSAAMMSAIQLGTQIMALGATVAIAVGWWWLSEPNPAAIDPSSGSTSRQFVRVAAGITVLFAVLQSAVGMVLQSGMNPATPGGTQVGLMGFAVLISLAGLVVFAVSYFSQMAYLKWLAPRFPNEWVFKRAKLMLWLGPVLYVVGAFCIGLGPLVALILYYNLVTRVRADLKGILGRMVSSA